MLFIFSFINCTFAAVFCAFTLRTFFSVFGGAGAELSISSTTALVAVMDFWGSTSLGQSWSCWCLPNRKMKFAVTCKLHYQHRCCRQMTMEQWRQVTGASSDLLHPGTQHRYFWIVLSKYAKTIDWDIVITLHHCNCIGNSGIPVIVAHLLSYFLHWWSSGRKCLAQKKSPQKWHFIGRKSKSLQSSFMQFSPKVGNSILSSELFVYNY